MHIWWLGQSGFLVQVAGERVLLDPYLSDSMTERYADTETPYERITGLVVEPSLLSFVDIVTSSHAHMDHLDPETLPHVLSGDAAFVCAAGSEQIAAERAGRLPDAVLGIDDDADVRRLLDQGRSRLPRGCSRGGRLRRSATAPTSSTTPVTRAACREWPRRFSPTAPTLRSSRSAASTET